MTFSCPNFDCDEGLCRKLKCECIPGRKGCVLEGRVVMSDDLRKRVEASRKKVKARSGE